MWNIWLLFTFVVHTFGAREEIHSRVAYKFSVQSSLSSCIFPWRVLQCRIPGPGRLTETWLFGTSVMWSAVVGVCVSTMMLGTDCLIALAMIVIWELPIIFPLAYFCVFGFIDGVFFTANLTKIPKGNPFRMLFSFAIHHESIAKNGSSTVRQELGVQCGVCSAHTPCFFTCHYLANRSTRSS